MNEKEKAHRYWRIAVLICLIVPLFEYAKFICTKHNFTLYWGVVVVAGVLLLNMVLVAWFAGLWLIELASSILHVLFGGYISRRRWNDATFRAMRIFPYAAGLAVATWLIYSIGKFDGYFVDAIFGVAGNLIGAWCYGTIIWNWIKLRRGRVLAG